MRGSRALSNNYQQLLERQLPRRPSTGTTLTGPCAYRSGSREPTVAGSPFCEEAHKVALYHHAFSFPTPATHAAHFPTIAMAGKKGDNSKKAAGNARKAEAAAQKAAVEDARREAAEDEKWQKGSKNNSKK
ncbi:hypothetical protein NM208_g15037 [Fusarium decemcellulare]|uniref:Uncharacterized protein n=1 Tax=Fusarium decemcellulare TaxID=57161 RepID=A0ACC1RG07_9HYPO|nr:hypothetical protein NM208_g15037 [Fusarium decemcellulare]